jgi:hypothetical protein
MPLCDDCGRVFQTAQALGSHRRYAHLAVSAGPSRAPVFPSAKPSSGSAVRGAGAASVEPSRLQPKPERKVPAWVWVVVVTAAALGLPLAFAALEGFPRPLQAAGGRNGV